MFLMDANEALEKTLDSSDKKKLNRKEERAFKRVAKRIKKHTSKNETSCEFPLSNEDHTTRIKVTLLPYATIRISWGVD